MSDRASFAVCDTSAKAGVAAERSASFRRFDGVSMLAGPRFDGGQLADRGLVTDESDSPCARARGC